MPPFVLIILLLVAGTWLEVFVLIPLELLRNLSLPNWLTLALLALVLSWCFGE